MKYYPAVLLMVLSGFAARSDEPQRRANPGNLPKIKSAWEYSEDERLARRFDPESIRERALPEATEPYGARPRIESSAHSDPGKLPNVIIGRRNPELFMPHELFVQLVIASIVEERRDTFRDRLNPMISEIMPTEMFWSRLESASAPYTALLRRELDLAAGLKEASSDDREVLLQQIGTLQEPQCATRADAIRAISAAVGEVPLLRVLYEGIAPTMAVSSSPQMSADDIRFIAGGCR